MLVCEYKRCWIIVYNPNNEFARNNAQYTDQHEVANKKGSKVNFPNTTVAQIDGSRW